MIKTILTILALVAVTYSTCDFSSDFCSAASLPCNTFARDTGSNSLTVGSLSLPGYEFDTVSFNDLTLNHGDVQGRVAVRNNFFGSNGVSVGDSITDNFAYSLIVGGSISIDGSAEVYPTSSGVFVGSSSSVPANLGARITGSNCGSTSGCLNSVFDNLFNYWNSFSANLGAQTASATVAYNSGVATFSCSGAANAYIISIDSTNFNTIIGYAFDASCSASASWAINIVGGGDVYFGGNSIVATGTIIFNIMGARSVIVGSSINGNVVAPSASVTMNGGTITGQLVAGNITNLIQVNRPNCPTTTGSASSGTVPTSSGSASGSASSSGSDDSGDNGNGASSTTGVATVVTVEPVATTGVTVGGGASNVENGGDSSSASIAIASILFTVLAMLF